MSEEREMIRSAQNKFISLARGLEDRKFRDKNRLFRFDGIKLMCEACRHGIKLSFVIICEGMLESVFEKAERLYGITESELDCRIIVAESRIFEKLTDEMSPEGVVCVAEYADHINSRSECGADLSGNGEKILLLESVRDPLNVGAIVRAAAAFGTDRIIMSRDCADIYNSKTLRASMGTVFGIRIDRVESISEAIFELRMAGRRVFAAALDRNSEKLGSFDIEEGDCILIGNEGHGLSKEAIEASDKTVFIPMADGVESLNAATAAAVLMWEFFGSHIER